MSSFLLFAVNLSLLDTLYGLRPLWLTYHSPLVKKSNGAELLPAVRTQVKYLIFPIVRCLISQTQVKYFEKFDCLLLLISPIIICRSTHSGKIL